MGWGCSEDLSVSSWHGFLKPLSTGFSQRTQRRVSWFTKSESQTLSVVKAAWEQPLWGPGGAGPHQLLFSIRGRLGFRGGSDGEEFACSVGDLGLIPGSGRSPGGGHGNPLQYSCLENPHGQRSLVGYSPWGHKESDTTERLTSLEESRFVPKSGSQFPILDPPWKLSWRAGGKWWTDIAEMMSPNNAGHPPSPDPDGGCWGHPHFLGSLKTSPATPKFLCPWASPSGAVTSCTSAVEPVSGWSHSVAHTALFTRHCALMIRGGGEGGQWCDATHQTEDIGVRTWGS